MVRIDNESPSFTFSKKAIETNKEQQNNTPISVFGDKNNNGIIDSEDFSKEELEKLGKTRAFGFFENFKWSENISKIFSALLNIVIMEKIQKKLSLKYNKEVSMSNIFNMTKDQKH